MPHPYQCLLRVTPNGPDGMSLLLAACGPKLLSTSTKDGSFLSQWTSSSAGLVEVENGSKAQPENGERPTKKQKTIEKAPSTLSNIIKLAASPDQRHVVTVTEDKCIRVFDIDSQGSLTELSQRIMPKRPCGIEVLPDNETIICADKFGDVYSLPLLPVDVPAKGAEAVAPEEASEPVKLVFKPSATNLTVHSQRNLKALEAQQKQKLFAPRKEALAFEHKLLLGHVSMLTDVAFATREVEGKRRGYIITADRDEHVRVSRGPPQAHIIEGYCLAHKEFISKLCLVPGTDLLVSGGGDPWICVWNWPSFALTRTVKLEQYFPDRLRTYQPATPTPIAVSGIWSVPLDSNNQQQAIVIACERYRSLTAFPSSGFGNETPSGTLLELPAAPVDVSFVDGRLVVSMDVREGDQPRLTAFRVTATGAATVLIEPESTFELSALGGLNKLIGIEEDPKAIDSLLYNTENLRKRTHDEPEQD